MDKFRFIVNQILENNLDSREVVQKARQHLVKFHLTSGRAEFFLDKIKKAFAS
jgi:hypothetical protein